MSVGNKVFYTMTAFGASCVAPSVHTFNAVSGGATLALGFGLATAAYVGVKPLLSKIGAPLKPASDKLDKTWIGRNFFKAAALSTAAIIATPPLLQTWSDVENGDNFAVAFGDNALRPGYNMLRYGVHEGLVPLGRRTTRVINGTIETAFDIDTPAMSHDPIFDARSSFRGRCIEPLAKLIFDGSVFLIDDKIRGNAPSRRGADRELLDSLTKRDVYYTAKPIC